MCTKQILLPRKRLVLLKAAVIISSLDDGSCCSSLGFLRDVVFESFLHELLSGHGKGFDHAKANEQYD